MISVGLPAGPIASPAQVCVELRQHRVEVRPRRVEVGADRREVVLAPADRDAEHHAARRDSASTDAACLASNVPLCRVGASRTVVASLMRSVTAPAAASAISGS